MKKLLFFLFFNLVIPVYTSNVTTDVVVQLENQQQEKMKLLFGLIDFPESLDDFVSVAFNDLSCSKQKKSGFDCLLRKFHKVPSKSALKNLAQEGYMMVVFLQMKSNDTLEWRVYDSMQAQMYCGKRMHLDLSNIGKNGHLLADALWKLLTGQEGIFSSKIAYCCEKIEGSHKGSDLYIQTPFADDAYCLVKGGKLLAPRWNKSSKNPLLLFSEVTPSNVRLMSTNMQGKKKIVSNVNGITSLPSFSSNGQNVVYCATHQGTSQLYRCFIDKKNKKKVIERKTHNDGNNISPNVRDNGDIIFCSDAEKGVPYVYYWHDESNKLEQITPGAAPNFSEKNGKVAYHRLVGTTIQIFGYDLAKKEDQQITFTPGNKDECCWSPCGNYLVYSIEQGKSCRIALYNMITKEETFLTDEKHRCSYPAWSSC